MQPSRAVVAALLVVSLATGVAAHESWLAASDWEPRPGEEVVVRSTLGSGFAGESRPFSAGRVKRLVVRQSGTTDLVLDGGAEAARFVPEDGHGVMVAFETEPVTVLMDAAEFDDHAVNMGFDDVIDLRLASDFDPQPARQRSSSCSKLWIGGNDWRRIRKPVGMPLEIVPRNEPTRVSTMRMRLLFRGKPLAGALVKAWMQPLDMAGEAIDPDVRLELPTFQETRTNELGIARIDVSRRGEYLVSAMHAVPCRDPEAADFDAWSASLTFARGAGRAAEWQTSRTTRTGRMLRGTGLGRNPDLGNPGFGWGTSLRDSPGWRR